MTVEELEQELLQLPSEDRAYLERVLVDSIDRKEERERHYELHLLPFIKQYPLRDALAELRSTMSGLPLNSRSLLIEALGRDLDLAWEEEIQRRMQALDRGEIETIDVETALADLEDRLFD